MLTMTIAMLLQAQTPLAACRVVDGDTIRCGATRIRLLAIDAPEMPGHCRKGRACAPGDPIASRDSLASAMRRGPLTMTAIGHDRYGRVLAQVRAGATDLSCWQLAAGQAIPRPDWDEGGLIRASCPTLAR